MHHQSKRGKNQYKDPLLVALLPKVKAGYFTCCTVCAIACTASSSAKSLRSMARTAVRSCSATLDLDELCSWPLRADDVVGSVSAPLVRI